MRTLRDACARLSPRLEHSLLAKRFPLINTFGSASALEQHEQFVQAIDAQLGESDTAAALTALPNCFAPAPRDLFRTFKDFEGENTYAVRPQTSIDLEAYTLSLELTARKIERAGPGEVWRFNGTQESIYVGTGELQSEVTDVTYKFTVPDAVREREAELAETDETTWSLIATIVVSRRGASGKLQFARIHRDHCTMHENGLDFDSSEMPMPAGNQALNFLKYEADNVDMYTDPVVVLHYTGPCTVEARFKWSFPNHGEVMTEHEARACLEHYAAWSE